MTKRTVTLSVLFCAWASAAAAQTYDPKTGIAELPGSPVAPTSYTQCDTLQQKWSQLSKAIEDAHQKCLDAHHTEPEDPRASFTPSNPVCSHPECQNLHTARIEIGQKSKERVDACRADVAQFQKKQQIAQQRMQALADQQQAQREAQQQQMSALESEIEARKAAAERQRQELERQRAEQLSQIEERHREASEKMAQALAQNLRAIEQREAAVGAPQASMTPSSVPPMSSGESQMLQGLVAENSADGNGNDANTAALLNGLQQAGGQDDSYQEGNSNQQGNPNQQSNPNQQGNSNQQGRDTPIPATGPCGVSGPSESRTQRGYGTSPTGAPRPMFVAFAFSTLGLHGFGGDGACGVGIDQNEQKAIDQSGVGCAIASLVPDWCGNGNGGHYQVCRADGKTKWVAIAVNNDGDSLDWSDGEAIGAETQDQAVKSALANCGRSGCQVKWSGSISCKK